MPSTLIADLNPVVETLLERHVSKAKEWFPHEFVPWDEARSFPPGYQWTEAETDIPAAVRSSLFVNLLTEDNLPYYSSEILETFGGSGPWGEWARRWTAEEGRHAIVIRDWLTAVRALDPVDLERGRMAQVCRGEVPHPPSAVHALAYVALQELATRISHHNTGKLLEGPGYEVMKRVAADENLHFLFYRDLVTAGLEQSPSEMVIAIDEVVRTFEMPGTGIPGFGGHARQIAAAGIYDFTVHYDQVVPPVVRRQWAIEERPGLPDEAEQARDRMLKYMAGLARAARRSRARREERAPQP